jgi:polysaccharide deacetylase 2 family uncharacterized protein YibQ
LVSVFAAGGSSALTGLGKFAEAITPSIAAQASDEPISPERKLLLSDLYPPSRSAPRNAPAGQVLPEALQTSLSEPASGSPMALPSLEGRMPVIAICIDDLGPDLQQTARAIALSKDVTLSFLPFAPATPTLARDAERAGHEVLAHVPMEAIGAIYPGPMTLRVGASDIAERLAWSLARVPGLSGVNNHEGSKFSTDAASLTPVVAMLASRHLFFFDSRTIAGSQIVRVAHRAGVASAGRDVFLDNIVSDAAITARLEELAAKARKSGVAIAIGHPHGATLRVLAAWLVKDHGVQLVPVSQAMRLKTDRAAKLALR